MKENAGCWATPEALKWMQIVLAERFGQEFSLHFQHDGMIALGCTGNTRRIEIVLGSNVFTRADSALPFANWDAVSEGWSVVLASSLPAPGAELLPSPLIVPIANGLRIQYDLLGLTYWMLTRQEEVGRGDLDEHERFPAIASHAFQHDYLERPIIDEWLHILGLVIAQTWPSLPLKKHGFTLKVSHDVDTPSLYAFQPWRIVARLIFGHLFKRQNLRAFINALRVIFGGRHQLHPADPYNNFDAIMDITERHGLQSAFYFICGYTNPLDANYEPEDPRIRRLMRRIHERGHEIGLHPGYDSFCSPDLVLDAATRLLRIAEKDGIRQPEWGGRMHYLRWNTPNTLRALVQAGMSYDSTLGYADRPGFRCGTCFEYPAFDPVAKQSLPLRIRPLIAMECSVIDPRYMNLGAGLVAKKKFLQLKSMCRAVNGCFTLLWHNSHLNEPQEWSLFEDILSE